MTTRHLHPDLGDKANWTEIPSALQQLVGPSSIDPEMVVHLDSALRFCGGIGPKGEPGAHAFEGKQQADEHFCQLDGDAYRWCSRIPGGGLTYCTVCGIPIFVPPETCIDYLEPEVATAVVDYHDSRHPDLS